MGRRKVITTENLIEQAEKYILECCAGNVMKFKIAQFSRYLIANGMPVNEPVIRRNIEFMNYISEKKNAKKSIAQKNVVFEMMDIDELLNSGRGIESLRRTLLNRENYYKSVYESFVQISKQSKEIEKASLETMNENEDLKREMEKMKKELNLVKTKLAETLALLKDYKSQITDFVYPAIAAEIIKLIEPAIPGQQDGIIMTDAVESKVVDANTDLFNNKLINDLFRSVERN